ncbi:MAG: hypothetical protein K2W99_04615 [Chthoniobacterales bacterium]|nr:hypothetical protein [Chthoniobacterales bacterium]
MIAEETTQERKFIGQPYEDNSVDAAAYEMEFIAAVKEGLAELDRGEFVTFEEIKKEFSSWVTK